MTKPNKNIYNNFVRQAQAVGFTDDQLDFLWDWLLQVVEDPKSFLHPDNCITEEKDI